MADPDDASAIGARARKIRCRRGLSLDVAAGLAGITKGYLSMLERGQRGFNRRGLIEDLADTLGCSVVDLTGQPYAPPDRGTADALATVPGISLAINDCTLEDVPDLPARPVEQLVSAAAAANAHLDAARFSLAGRELGAVLAELHVAAVTGSTDTRRAALAALAEACLVGASIARHLGHADLAVQTARRGYDAARQLGDSTRARLLTMHRALGLGWIGARHRVAAVLDDALAEITPDPSAADTGPAQAAGMLHLTAALNHARQNRTGDADDHLGAASELAATPEKATCCSNISARSTSPPGASTSLLSCGAARPPRRACTQTCPGCWTRSARRCVVVRSTSTWRGPMHRPRVIAIGRRSSAWTPRTGWRRSTSGPTPWPEIWCSPWTGVPGDGCGSWTAFVTASVSAASVHEV